MNLIGGENIRKKIKLYLKNITENNEDKINTFAIIEKDKLIYNNKEVKNTIKFIKNDIILIRETKEFKNILTFSKNRSILSEYIIKENNLCLELLIETLELFHSNDSIYIKYKVVDTDFIYEYKIVVED